MHQLWMQGKVLLLLFHACLFDTAPLRETLFLQRPPCSELTLHCVYTQRVRHARVCVLVYLFACIFENMRAEVYEARTRR